VLLTAAVAAPARLRTGVASTLMRLLRDAWNARRRDTKVLFASVNSA
jgi:hypothetical protein